MPFPNTFAEIMAAEAWMMYLPRHEHRATHSAKLLADVGFNVHIVPGVDGFRDDTASIASASGWKFADYCKPGELGASMSLFRLFQRIVDEGRDFAVIFEDDALPHPQFATLSEEWWKETPKDFDVLYLGSQMEAHGDGKVATAECFLTHAIMVTSTGAEKMLELIRRDVYDGLDKGDILLIKWQKDKLIRHYAWSAKSAALPVFADGDSPWKRDSGLIYQNFKLGSTIHGEDIDFT